MKFAVYVVLMAEVLCVVLSSTDAAAGRPGGFKQQVVKASHQHVVKHHQPKRKSEGGANLLKDDNLIQDKDHIQEDLKGQFSDEHIKSMSEKELEYHYFKAHDFDNNNKLDGLELMLALAHVIQEEDGEEQSVLDSHQISLAEEMVDDVLADGDRNKDGYVNYGEYRLARRKQLEKTDEASVV